MNPPPKSPNLVKPRRPAEHSSFQRFSFQYFSFQHFSATQTPLFPRNPLFPASGPATISFNGLHAKSGFLAAPLAHEKALDFSGRLLRQYLADRRRVRAGCLVEIRYEDLVADGFGLLERVYGELSLPGWENCRRAIEKCGPASNPRRAGPSRPVDEKNPGRIVETHAPIDESGLYPLPALA